MRGYCVYREFEQTWEASLNEKAIAEVYFAYSYVYSGPLYLTAWLLFKALGVKHTKPCAPYFIWVGDLCLVLRTRPRPK